MSGKCPELEMLGAFAEGGLFEEERKAIESHLAECDDCLDTVIFVFKVMKEVPFPGPPELK